MAQGATLLHEPEDDERSAPIAQLSQHETGVTYPLRTVGHYAKSTSPWLSAGENPGPFDKAMAENKKTPGKGSLTFLSLASLSQLG